VIHLKPKTRESAWLTHSADGNIFDRMAVSEWREWQLIREFIKQHSLLENWHEIGRLLSENELSRLREFRLKSGDIPAGLVDIRTSRALWTSHERNHLSLRLSASALKAMERNRREREKAERENRRRRRRFK